MAKLSRMTKKENTDCNMLSLLRIIKFALQDIIRNLGLSSMTILILVLMLLSVNMFVVINVLTGEAVKAVKNQIDVSIFFQAEATEKQIAEIKNYVSAFPEVKETTYLTSEQVLAQFREQHKDSPEVLASLAELGENPLGSTLIVKTREPQDYEKIVKALAVPEYESLIEAKTFGDTEIAIARIQSITNQVEKFTAGVSVLFALIAFLIIFNTIRVAIYTQRVEITIKKLVGASNWFVRGPYLIEALVFTCFSLLLTGALVYISLIMLDPYMAVIFGAGKILTTYYFSNIILLFSAQFGGVLLLTLFSSLLAMRKHLRA